MASQTDFPVFSFFSFLWGSKCGGACYMPHSQNICSHKKNNVVTLKNNMNRLFIYFFFLSVGWLMWTWGLYVSYSQNIL